MAVKNNNHLLNALAQLDDLARVARQVLSRLIVVGEAMTVEEQAATAGHVDQATAAFKRVNDSVPPAW